MSIYPRFKSSNVFNSSDIYTTTADDENNVKNISNEIAANLVKINLNKVSIADNLVKLESDIDKADTSINAITSSISTLQSLQNGDTTSFEIIQSNFDTLDSEKLNISDFNAFKLSSKFNINLSPDVLVLGTTPFVWGLNYY